MIKWRNFCASAIRAMLLYSPRNSCKGSKVSSWYGRNAYRTALAGQVGIIYSEMGDLSQELN